MRDACLNGGHLERPKATIVSVYAFVAHTGPTHSGRPTTRPSSVLKGRSDVHGTVLYTHTHTHKLVQQASQSAFCTPFKALPFVSLMPGDNHRPVCNISKASRTLLIRRHRIISSRDSQARSCLLASRARGRLLRGRQYSHDDGDNNVMEERNRRYQSL